MIWTMDWSNRRYRRIVDEFRLDGFRLLLASCGQWRQRLPANYKRQKQRCLLSKSFPLALWGIQWAFAILTSRRFDFLHCNMIGSLVIW